VGQISWSQFIEAQLPACGLTLLLGAVTWATTAGTRHAGLSPVLGLVGGAAAATGTAALAVWLAPSLTLGPHGMRMRDTLRAFLAARLRPGGLRGST
jgi:hypothetical protein